MPVTRSRRRCPGAASCSTCASLVGMNLSSRPWTTASGTVNRAASASGGSGRLQRRSSRTPRRRASDRPIRVRVTAAASAVRGVRQAPLGGRADRHDARQVAVGALRDPDGVAQHRDRTQRRTHQDHPWRQVPGGDDGRGHVEPLEVAEGAQAFGLAVAPHVVGDHGMALGPQLVRHGDHGGVVAMAGEPVDQHDGGGWPGPG